MALLTIEYDENSHVSLPDIKIETKCRSLIDIAKKTDVYYKFGNFLILNGFRYVLLTIPLESRPNVKWIINKKEVTFDVDMRSDDAWDKYTDVFDDFLMGILEGRNLNETPK